MINTELSVAMLLFSLIVDSTVGTDIIQHSEERLEATTNDRLFINEL